MMRVVRRCLQKIGYQDDLLLPDYKFRNFLKKSPKQGSIGQIELAAFAQTPPSFRSACFGVTLPSDENASSIIGFRALGAPQVLALHPEKGFVQRWRIPAYGDPKPLDIFSIDTLGDVFESKRTEWEPRRILSAKTLGFVEGEAQLDFLDSGLLPALEAQLRPKLNRDIQNILVRCRNVYEQWNVGGEFDSILEPLFRLIFRLIAAKMLIDREDKLEWNALDASAIVREVEAFYFRQEQVEPALADIPIRVAAWEQIRQGLNLQNLSTETLAYVYENAFVTQGVRRRLGIHATPQELAEYIVRQLPIEELDWQERIVFEPFTGAAPFLTAALGRLRELLPGSLSASERHDYFVQMLCGIESDPFSREIARYSLILADYPNPDGWRIDVTDAFTDSRFNTYLNAANIILCNPPHENFGTDEREGQDAATSINKGAEALRRVLKRQPPAPILGFVLPRSFLDRSAFRQLRQEVMALYKNVSVTILPDKVFKKASQEVALLLADNVRVEDKPYSYASVSANDYAKFLSTGEATYQEAYATPLSRNSEIVLWQTPLQKVWEALSNCLRFGSLAGIHVGVHYKTGLVSECVSDEAQEDFVQGIQTVAGYMESYLISDYQYLCTKPEVMRDNAYLLPWGQPKVLVNRARTSRDYWNIAGALEEQGLYASVQFYGIWAKDETPIEVIAALICSPVANAFLFGFPSKRENQIGWIKQIPVPQFTVEQTELIVSLVQEYYSQRGQWITEPKLEAHYQVKCLDLIYQIDAAVLEAYALPPELERDLLNQFEGVERRPLPFHFPGYGEEYERAKEALKKEKAYRSVLKQYHTLVDRKYIKGLNALEIEEMERLRREIDKHNAPFYEPILQELSARLVK